MVKRNDQDISYQRFRQPGDALSTTMADLPKSSHYFIHPALSEYIQQARPSTHFRVVQQILVGENAAWHPFDPVIYQIELALADVNDVSLRNLTQDFLAQAKVVKLSANPRSLRVELESSLKWKELERRLSAAGHDDVLLWMEALHD